MSKSDVMSSIRTTQQALSVVALLNLTSYMYSQDKQVKNGTSFDIIVVGAGSAGSVIANRLTENKSVTVLLIEAGGDPPIESVLPSLWMYNKNSRIDWNFTSANLQLTKQCHSKKHFELSAGKVLGGTSSTNFMFYFRGNPGDYHKWAVASKDDTWEWKNVLPYFIKSENLKDATTLNSPARSLHGTNGYMAVTKDKRKASNVFLAAAQELGYEVVDDINGNQTTGYTHAAYTIDSVRQSTANCFIRPIINRPNFYLLKNTLVTKVIFDRNKNAIGVQAINENNEVVTYKANKEVVVSAGAVNSPKLLMLSKIGPRNHLRRKNIEVIADLPVGQNYQEHVVAVVIHTVKKLKVSVISNNPHELKFPVFIGYVALNQSKYPNYRAFTGVQDGNALHEACLVYYRISDDICDYLHKRAEGRTVALTFVIKLNPKSRGEVTLRSNNPEDPPVINTGYYTNEEDLEDTVTYLLDMIRIVNTTVYKKMDGRLLDPIKPRSTCCNFVYGSREYWRCYARCMMGPSQHSSSTCAMGSVVDGRLRVFKVGRLRVADASVMPYITSDPTNAATIMIGEKAADFIKQDHNF